MLAALCAHAQAADATRLERTTTLSELFDATQARELGRTLPPDRPVRFQLRIPADTAPRDLPMGAVVFVKADDSGEFIESWARTFDERRLIWVSADGFGNRKPAAQRVLVAMMARELVGRVATLDANRVYLAGMSGGGRVASQTITRFPQNFAGALYVVGADFHLPAGPLRHLALERRYVFITGSQDFNRREMRRVSRRYTDAGAERVLLIDEAGFGHQHATPALLGRALEFLDAR
jgi:pimeloyl-ACP methyl ester carboxylesterase